MSKFKTRFPTTDYSTLYAPQNDLIFEALAYSGETSGDAAGLEQRKIFLPDPINSQHQFARNLLAKWQVLPGWLGGTNFYGLKNKYKGVLTATSGSKPQWKSTVRPGGFGELLFNSGSNTNYVSVGAVLGFSAEPFAIHAWIRTTSNTAQFRAIAGKGYLASLVGYGLYVDTSNFPVFQVRNLATVSSATGGTAVNDGKWHFLLGVRSGGVTKLYVDGVLAASDSTAVTIGSDSSLFEIGARDNSGPGFNFPGSIDDVAVYNRNFTAQEVFDFYTLLKDGSPDFLNRPDYRTLLLKSAPTSVTGSGGVLLAGSATNNEITFNTGSNGVLLAGSATNNKFSLDTGSSGVLLAGSTTNNETSFNTGASGVLLAGSATNNETSFDTGSSGVLLAGSGALAGFNVFNETGSGGVLLAGSAANNEITFDTGSSGVLLAGSATNNKFSLDTGSSGILLAGSGVNNETSFDIGSSGVLVAGTVFLEEAFFYDPNTSPPLKISGSAIAFVSGQGASGGLHISGEATCRATYTYYSTGNNNNSPPNNSGISVGYQSFASPTTINFSSNDIFDFLWEVDAFDELSFDFTWNVGASRRYWYRVVGTSKIDGCPPLDVGDGCCRQYVTNILARSTEDLCHQLQASGWRWPIDSVQRFSKPAETAAIAADAAQGITHDCNQLIPVDLCSNPGCLDFCIDFDLVDNWGASVFAQLNAFPTAEASGGLTLSGIATTSFTQNFFNKTYQATGGLHLSGTGDTVSSGYTYIASGGVQTSGTPSLMATNWTFLGGVWPSDTLQLSGNTSSQFNQTSTDVAWTNIAKALTSDDQYAVCDLSSGNNSQFLVISGFNAGLPTNINVLGIQATIERHASASVRDLEVYLMLGSQIISDNMASATNWPIGSDFASVIGGEFSLWKTGSWDINTLNDPSLGLAIRVSPITVAPGVQAFIDNVQLKFFYEQPVYQRLRIGGTAAVQSSNYRYIASGGLSVSGPDQSVSVSRIVKDVGVGILGPRYTSLTVSGRYAQGFTAQASGGVTISGQAKVVSSSWNYSATGGLTVSGTAPTQSSNYHWTAAAGGDPTTGGSAFVSAHYNYLPSGSISFSGSYSTQGSHLTYQATGGVHLIGEAEVISTDYQFLGSGGLTFAGIAFQQESDLGLLLTEASLSAFAEDVGFIFNDTATSTFTEPHTSVSGCSCNNLSTSMPFRQNLAQNNKFAQFLARNNQTFPDILDLKYNQINNSWQVNALYTGYSTNTPNKETWKLMIDLQCTTNLGGTDLGQSVWKMGFQILQKDLTTLQEFDSRILVGFTPIVCNSAPDFKFTINFNTQSGLATITPNAKIYHNRIYDNIGLFKEPFWINNPNLTLAISNTGFSAPVPRIPLVIT